MHVHQCELSPRIVDLEWKPARRVVSERRDNGIVVGSTSGAEYVWQAKDYRPPTPLRELLDGQFCVALTNAVWIVEQSLRGGRENEHRARACPIGELTQFLSKFGVDPLKISRIGRSIHACEMKDEFGLRYSLGE